MNKILIIALIAIAVSFASGQDSRCLQCICQIESNCQNLPCKWDVNSLSCGWYQIKEVYWIDCGKPGGSWTACASDKTCSETCVRNYMTRYATRCTGILIKKIFMPEKVF